MIEKINYLALSDQDLLVKIKENTEALGVVYKKCKPYSIRFMQKMTSGSMNNYELDDVFHDAVIILYEKIISGNFVLTCTLQVYLNSVCRFQLLNKIAKSKLITDFKENTDQDGDDESSMSYKSTITDSLEEIENPKEEKYKAIERALEVIKNRGGHCYELLTLFWYHKKSMNELTELFGYTNEVNTRNQKARCQKRLEKIAYNELHP
jgi:RNA polymerase sigma factor (sigma-70 family)